MTVVSVDKDFDSMTITLVAEFEASIERVWQLWADPRKLERWWGPANYPATFETHDLTPGGEATYVMTGPNGEESRGWWRVTSVDPPTSLELVDGSAAADGAPIADTPTTTIEMRLSEHEGGTRMVLRSIFDSREHMQRIVDIGAADVWQTTVGQMDALLAG